MLVNVASYVEEEGGNPLRLALYGQELNPDILVMGKLGVLLHGLSAAGLEGGRRLHRAGFGRRETAASL